MRNSRKVRLVAGITLIETLFGIFVTVGGTMAVLSMASVSTKVSKQTEVRSIALQAAREKLESLKMLAQSNRPGVNQQPFTIPAAILAQFPAGKNGIEMTGEYSIRQAPADDALQQITVAVRWRSVASTQNFGSAPWSEVSLTTLTSVQPLNISWTGIYEPPPDPTTGGTTGTDGSTDGGGWYPTTNGGSTGGGGNEDNQDGGGGSSEEAGGCTFTYGPC